jgi:hypothetical protein
MHLRNIVTFAKKTKLNKIMPSGRPCKPIDWEIVESMIEAGCTLTGIASRFRIDPTNFSDQFVNRYGVLFTYYAAKLRCTGIDNIRHIQYQKALEGNTQMLTILGREWLGQEREQKQASQSDSDRLDSLISQLESLRSSSNQAKINKSTDDKS